MRRKAPGHPPALPPFGQATWLCHQQSFSDQPPTDRLPCGRRYHRLLAGQKGMSGKKNDGILQALGCAVIIGSIPTGIPNEADIPTEPFLVHLGSGQTIREEGEDSLEFA